MDHLFRVHVIGIMSIIYANRPEKAKRIIVLAVIAIVATLFRIIFQKIIFPYNEGLELMGMGTLYNIFFELGVVVESIMFPVLVLVGAIFNKNSTIKKQL